MISVVLSGIAAEEAIPVTVFPGMSPQHRMLVQALAQVAASNQRLFLIVRGWEGFCVRLFGFDIILQTWPNLHPYVIFALRPRALQKAFCILPGLGIANLIGWHSQPSAQSGLCYSELYDMATISDVQHGRVVNARYQELVDRIRECEQARMFQLPLLHRNAILSRGAYRNIYG